MTLHRSIGAALVALAILAAGSPGPAAAQQDVTLSGTIDAPTTGDLDTHVRAAGGKIASNAERITAIENKLPGIGEMLEALRLSDERLAAALADLEARLSALEGVEPPPEPEPIPPIPDPKPPFTLTDSGPVAATHDGQVIEGLAITSSSGTALSVNGYANVVIRNVEVRHSGGRGIWFRNAPRTTIENVNVIHEGAPASGPNPSSGLINIACENSDDATIRRARLTRGSSGIFMLNCDRSRLSFLEGYDFRGPLPRGQLVQWDTSHGGLLQDFSVINPLDTAWTEDNVNVFGSSDVTIRRGLVDGNNSPSGQGVIFEHDVRGGAWSGGLVEDVDTVRMGNGSFGYKSHDVTFRRVRARDNHCEGVQGRAAPRSGSLIFSIQPTSSWGVHYEDAVWFNACNRSNITWSSAAPDSSFDVREADFTPRAAIVLEFPWE
jgi:hypothetical protein